MTRTSAEKLHKAAIIVLAIVMLFGVGCLCAHADEPAGNKQAVNESVEKTGAVKAESVIKEVEREEKADEFLASLTQEEDGKKTEREEPVYITVLGMIAKLAVVLALAYLAILGLKKLNLSNASAPFNPSKIRVIESTTIAANRNLHLISVGGKKMLIASTPSQVNLISEFDEEYDESDIPDEPDNIVKRTSSQPSSFNFREHMVRFLGVGANTAKTETTMAEDLRNSTSYVQDKVVEVAGLRKRFTDAS